jgi:hypothetical protein
MSISEHSTKTLGKDESNFFFPTSKKCISPVEINMQSETCGVGVRIGK